MGFSVGMLIGVVLASYGLGAFNLPNSNRSIAGLNYPWIQERHERPVTLASTAALARAAGCAVIGFSIGMLLGVILASYAVGAFNLPQSNSSSAILNCPWIQETHELPVGMASMAPACSRTSQRQITATIAPTASPCLPRFAGSHPSSAAWPRSTIGVTDIAPRRIGGDGKISGATL
jgi:hypothetical protein